MILPSPPKDAPQHVKAANDGAGEPDVQVGEDGECPESCSDKEDFAGHSAILIRAHEFLLGAVPYP